MSEAYDIERLSCEAVDYKPRDFDFGEGYTEWREDIEAANTAGRKYVQQCIDSWRAKDGDIGGLRRQAGR